MITAAVLAGGFGTRLRPVMAACPKVLAPVAGRPFLSYLLQQLADAGVTKTVLCTGHLAAQVREATGESYAAMRLLYSQEQQPLGTAGALRGALPLLDTDPVLVLNGDSYCELDLRKFCGWHKAKHAAAAVALAQVPDVSRFGRVECGSEQRIVRFGEKNGSGPGWINAGIYLIAARLLAAIPNGACRSLEHECFPAWLEEGLYGYAAGSNFLDIGTPESYAEAESFFAARSRATHARPVPQKVCLGFSRAATFAGSRGRSEVEPSVRCRKRTSRFSDDADNLLGIRPLWSRPGPVRRRYVLLDRDGTLNVEKGYLSAPEELELLPGVAPALLRLQARGLGLVVLTNQSGIGRGYLDRANLDRIHARLRELLSAEGVVLDAIYYCPHTPQDGCGCRKPATGLVESAAAELGFDPRQAFLIGDKQCDIELGARVGATTILVRTGYGAQEEARVQPDHVVDDLPAAAGTILRALQGRTFSAVSSSS